MKSIDYDIKEEITSVYHYDENNFIQEIKHGSDINYRIVVEGEEYHRRYFDNAFLIYSLARKGLTRSTVQVIMDLIDNINELDA